MAGKKTGWSISGMLTERGIRKTKEWKRRQGNKEEQALLRIQKTINMWTENKTRKSDANAPYSLGTWLKMTIAMLWTHVSSRFIGRTVLGTNNQSKQAGRIRDRSVVRKNGRAIGLCTWYMAKEYVEVFLWLLWIFCTRLWWGEAKSLYDDSFALFEMKRGNAGKMKPSINSAVVVEFLRTYSDMHRLQYQSGRGSKGAEHGCYLERFTKQNDVYTAYKKCW